MTEKIELSCSEHGKKRQELAEAEARLQNTRQSILETIFGQVDWINDHCGYLQCPGEHLHTTPSGDKDCVVYLDEYPHLHCFHQHCQEIVHHRTMVLRKALAGDLLATDLADLDSVKVRIPKAMREKREAAQRLKNRGAELHDQILKDYPWSLEEMRESSPTELDDPEEHGHQLLRLWQPDDLVWIGKRWQARPEDKRVRRVSDWLKTVEWPDEQLICPAVMRSVDGGRRNVNVLAKRFCVLERDDKGVPPEENRKLTLPVFRWLKEHGLKLRAVVDTGGKSLHGWFEYPGHKQAEMLKNLFAGFPHYDVAGIKTLSHSVRLPGSVRTYEQSAEGMMKIYQELLYLDLTHKP